MRFAHPFATICENANVFDLLRSHHPFDVSLLVLYAKTKADLFTRGNLR